MNIFNHFLGWNSDKRRVLNMESIATMFKTDIFNIPDESFIELKQEYDLFGPMVKTFQKRLNYLECGIFNGLEVYIVKNKELRIVFFNENPKKIKPWALKKLMNTLVSRYGVDDSNYGKFTYQDLIEYRDSEFSHLFGRSWSCHNDQNLLVSFKRDNGRIYLIIEVVYL